MKIIDKKEADKYRPPVEDAADKVLAAARGLVPPLAEMGAFFRRLILCDARSARAISLSIATPPNLRRFLT
jgi:hypothetical protein